MRWMKRALLIVVIISSGAMIWFFWPVSYPTVAPPDSFQGERKTPSGPLRLYVMKVGYSAHADYRDLVAQSEAKTADLPTLVYLVDHPQGKVLIDSGYGKGFVEHASRFPHSLFFKLIRPTLPADLSLEHHLSQIGVSLDEITHIVLTHAHNDHAGGAQDCLQAKVYVPKAEWEDATGTWLAPRRGFMPEQLTGLEDRLAFVDYRPDTPYGTFERSFDLFGDGSVVLVSTPGHTAGSQSVFVNLPSGQRFLFVGDTAWVAENYRIPAPKGRLARRLLEYDERAVWESLLRIRKLAELDRDITIVPGHDPNVIATLKHLPEFYE
jgi:N-acyl homoserine lactone hydrolase